MAFPGDHKSMAQKANVCDRRSNQIENPQSYPW